VRVALVVAALDIPLLQCKGKVDPSVLSLWCPLPPSSSLKERWPPCHWCRCIASHRVAPSVAYAAELKAAFQTHCGEGVGCEGKSSELLAAYTQTMQTVVFNPVRDVDTDPAERHEWYFAYGSNLSWEQVCVRIGPPYQRRAVRLDDYVLVANKTPLDLVKYASFGYYNVEPVAVRQAKIDAGKVPHISTMPPFVCGAVYDISAAQLAMMDTFETGYRRELHRCIDLGDGTSSSVSPDTTATAMLDCWVYVAEETAEEVLPSREYLGRVLEGADILPPDYMMALRATKTNPLRSPRQDQRLRKEL